MYAKIKLNRVANEQSFQKYDTIPPENCAENSQQPKKQSNFFWNQRTENLPCLKAPIALICNQTFVGIQGDYKSCKCSAGADFIT